MRIAQLFNRGRRQQRSVAVEHQQQAVLLGIRLLQLLARAHHRVAGALLLHLARKADAHGFEQGFDSIGLMAGDDDNSIPRALRRRPLAPRVPPATVRRRDAAPWPAWSACAFPNPPPESPRVVFITSVSVFCGVLAAPTPWSPRRWSPDHGGFSAPTLARDMRKRSVGKHFQPQGFQVLGIVLHRLRRLRLIGVQKSSRQRARVDHAHIDQVARVRPQWRRMAST